MEIREEKINKLIEKVTIFFQQFPIFFEDVFVSEYSENHSIFASCFVENKIQFATVAT